MSYGTNPPYGWGGPEPVECWLYNGISSAILAGQIVAFALNKAAATGATDNLIGSKTSSLSWTDGLGAAVGQKQGILAVAQTAIPINGYGKFTLRGICQCLVGTVAGATAGTSGQLLSVVTGKTYQAFESQAIVTGVCAGILLEAVSTITPADGTAMATVMFDGIEPYYRYWAS